MRAGPERRGERHLARTSRPMPLEAILMRLQGVTALSAAKGGGDASCRLTPSWRLLRATCNREAEVGRGNGQGLPLASAPNSGDSDEGQPPCTGRGVREHIEGTAPCRVKLVRWGYGADGQAPSPPPSGKRTGQRVSLSRQTAATIAGPVTCVLGSAGGALPWSPAAVASCRAFLDGSPAMTGRLAGRDRAAEARCGQAVPRAASQSGPPAQGWRESGKARHARHAACDKEALVSFRIFLLVTLLRGRTSHLRARTYARGA